MNNLTTRKIVLGMLMALVLVFSVQGTADAITKFTRGSGDLKLYAPDQDFKVSFSVSLQDRVVDTPADTANDIAATYHYDNEGINIGVTGASITKVGTYDITPAGDHTMTESGTNATKLSSSVSLTLRAAVAGPVAITITDASDTNRPANTLDAIPLIFTVYIAPTHNDTSTIVTINDGLDFSIDEEQINTYFTNDSLANVRVTYTVSGSGSVYVKTDNNKGSGSKNLTTSSEAPVFLNMGGSTNKVTISVVGQRAERALSVTYIYSHATLTKYSGDKQAGAVDSKLANPLVVRVTDGKNRNVSGVQIDFTATAAGGGSILRDPNLPIDLYVADNMVKTNSSGLANVFWQLGADAGDPQTATAMLAGATPIQADTVMFTATFGTKISTASSIVKESGDGQRANKFNVIEDPLVVTVRDELGQLLVKARVEFLARDGGTLSSPGVEDPGTEATSAEIAGYSGGSSRRVIFTDSSGQASVRYSPPQGGDRRTVSAGILGTARSVIFAVNGAPSTGGGNNNNNNNNVTNTITISPSSVSGAPGETETITVSNPAGVLVELSSSSTGFPQSNFLACNRNGDQFHKHRHATKYGWTIYHLCRWCDWWCHDFRFSDRYGSNHSIGYPHCF